MKRRIGIMLGLKCVEILGVITILSICWLVGGFMVPSPCGISLFLLSDYECNISDHIVYGFIRVLMGILGIVIGGVVLLGIGAGVMIWITENWEIAGKLEKKCFKKRGRPRK